MAKNRNFLCRFCLGLVTILCACSTTKLTAVWVDRTHGNVKPYERLGVVAVSESKASQRLYEDRLVALLIERGVSAVPGYTVSEEPARLEELRPSLKKQNIDAILVSRVVAVSREWDYVPRYLPAYYTLYDEYLFNSFRRPFYYRRGYFVVDTRVVLETNLYDVASGRLVWSAQSETLNPDSTETLAASAGPKLIEGLLAQGLVGNRTL